MARDQAQKQASASSAIRNSATPLSKDKRDMVPNPTETDVDTDAFRWLTKAKDPKQDGSGSNLIDGFTGMKGRLADLTTFEDIKSQAAGLNAGLKQKVNNI